MSTSAELNESKLQPRTAPTARHSTHKPVESNLSCVIASVNPANPGELGANSARTWSNRQRESVGFSPQSFTHLTPLYHSRHDRRGRRAGRPGDRSREGLERRVQLQGRTPGPLGRCGANDAYGTALHSFAMHRLDEAIQALLARKEDTSTGARVSLG